MVYLQLKSDSDFKAIQVDPIVFPKLTPDTPNKILWKGARSL